MTRDLSRDMVRSPDFAKASSFAESSSFANASADTSEDGSSGRSSGPLLYQREAKRLPLKFGRFEGCVLRGTLRT